MNLLISILLITTSLMAKTIISIKSNQENMNNAIIVRNRLIEYYKIPMALISITNEECSDDSLNNIELCIENDGNLKIRKKNSELISSLQIFNRPY